MQRLEDEIDYLQYGQSSESEFYGYWLSESLPSAWNVFPTAKNPSTRYKYLSIEYNMSLDVLNWNRQTYSLLDWLGDLGGLLDILLHIGHMIVFPISTFTLKQLLMSSFFRYKFSDPAKNRSEIAVASELSSAAAVSKPLNFVQTVKKELTAV